ncbi:hypothetical protein DOY81_000737 [Sarcophaga bullata]|nr:hypothetical protein DOY81_000737 [Sarcophaga bullata]
MFDKIKILYLVFIVLMIVQLACSSEFSAEAEPSPSVEDPSAEDSLLGPQIVYDMLSHKNPAINKNELKELWEKLPDYESIDIK